MIGAPAHKHEPSASEPNAKAIKDAEWIASLMDARFRVPGTSFRFGYDSIFGILPGIGDTLTLVIGFATILNARRMNAPVTLVVRMGWNLLVDWLIGLLPVVGFVFDSMFKAHSANAKLLLEWANREEIQ